MKTLYIIAGCNGAGKTTASYTVLPEIWKCKEFVNADEIARGLSPFNPEGVAIEAGRLMLQRINQLLDMDGSFSIETTLSTRSYVKLIDKALSILSCADNDNDFDEWAAEWINKETSEYKEMIEFVAITLEYRTFSIFLWKKSIVGCL